MSSHLKVARFITIILFLHFITIPIASAGIQADKAVAAVKKLINSGEIKPGTVLRLQVKQGNITSFLGIDLEMKNEWEKNTGILIDASVMPQLASQAFIKSAANVDLTIARNHEYPDLYENKLIEDLTPYFKQFGFSLSSDIKSGFMLLEQQAHFGNRIVAIPADGDVGIMYMRKDLVENSDNKKRFKEKYGYELKAPRTWKEYQDMVEFFHSPQTGFYGALEPREKLTGWMYWMPRYLSLALPNQYLFDDKMKPLINSKAGIAATQSYIATIPFSPPQILEQGKDYSYTLPFFLKGNGFTTLSTPAGAKIFSQDTAPVKDKFMVVSMPGHVISKKLLRRTTLIYGNNLVIPYNAPNKTLAFLYAMWLTDPDISARSVAMKGGFADPYRYNHMQNEKVRKMYTGAGLDHILRELAFTTPSGTGLPGDAEYIEALNENLWKAAKGEITPKQAMDNTARKWEAITDRLGRAKQISYWKIFKKRYPTISESAN